MEEKRLEYDDPEQSARFIETAERIQADDAEERFEDAMKRILVPKQRKVEQDNKS
jgi:hypothetical protein